MANTQDLTALPNPPDFYTGRILSAAAMARVGGVQNWGLGTGGTFPTLVQAVPDLVATGWCQHTGAAQNLFAAPHRMVTISTAHTQARCYVRATVSGGGAGAQADIVFTSATAAANVTVSFVGAGGPTDLSGLLTIDATANSEDITATVETFDGATVTIHEVKIRHEPLASPIPAGTVVGPSGEPIGILSQGADYAQSAASNHRLVGNLEHLITERLRPWWSWVGLDPALGDEVMRAERMHMSWIPVIPGGRDRDAEGTFWVYARNTSGSDKHIYPLVGDFAEFPNQQIEPITVPNAFSGWLSVTFVPIEGVVTPDFPFKGQFVGILPWDGTTERRGHTSAEVLSVSTWGH